MAHALHGTFADIGLGARLFFGLDEFCIQTIDGPNTEIADDIETTNSCSTQKEFIPGIPDGGTLTMTINFDPDFPVIPDRIEKSLVIVFPKKKNQSVGAKYLTRAYVKSAPKSIAINDVMTESVTFKITGTEEFRKGT